MFNTRIVILGLYSFLNQQLKMKSPSSLFSHCSHTKASKTWRSNSPDSQFGNHPNHLLSLPKKSLKICCYYAVKIKPEFAGLLLFDLFPFYT